MAKRRTKAPSSNSVHKRSPKSPKPKKVEEIQAPANMPIRGATMSPHAQNYYGRRSSSSTLSEPKTNWFKRRNWRRIAKRTFLTLFLVLVVGAGWAGWKFYENFGGITGLWGLLHSSKLKGEDVGRVNILLAGNSADDPGHNGANLTDSIMILSIDTRDNTAFMLSIPRDLYVALPPGACPAYSCDSSGHGKINQAILDSNFSQVGYPSGGMGDLENVITQDFGIPIDYYALINYGAFRDAVNAVGGITVNINSPDGRLYDPSIDLQTRRPLVDLTNGVHTLNGQQALDFARARGDGYGSIGFERSDFQRQADQRMMLSALEKKATTIGVLSNPVRLGSLFDSIGKNVKTDLNVSDMHRLYDLSKNFNGHIKSDSLSYGGVNPLLTNYTTPMGQDALVPSTGLDDYSAIRQYIQQITYVSANPKK